MYRDVGGDGTGLGIGLGDGVGVGSGLGNDEGLGVTTGDGDGVAVTVPVAALQSAPSKSGTETISIQTRLGAKSATGLAPQNVCGVSPQVEGDGDGVRRRHV